MPPDWAEYLVVSANRSEQLVVEEPLQVTLDALAGGVELLLESITGKLGAAAPAGCAAGAARTAQEQTKGLDGNVLRNAPAKCLCFVALFEKAFATAACCLLLLLLLLHYHCCQCASTAATHRLLHIMPVLPNAG